MSQIVSSVKIRQACLQDQEEIVALLEGFSPGVPDHWRKIFAPRLWEIENNFPGFVLVDQNKIEGFLGVILSEHDTETQGTIRVCNLTTWYVAPKYRQYSVALYLTVLKLSGISCWTNLTSTPTTYPWLEKIGFKPLQNKQTIILPVPKLTKSNKNIEIITTNSQSIMNPDNLRIYHTHRNLCCQHIIIQVGNSQCYCILVRTRHKKIPLAKIYYLSDADLFRRVIDDIRVSLCWKLKVCYLQIEGDICSDLKMLGAWVKKLYPPRLFKSDRLSKEQVPILNSEFFVLGI